jgi:hypothetical protein
VRQKRGFNFQVQSDYGLYKQPNDHERENPNFSQCTVSLVLLMANFVIGHLTLMKLADSLNQSQNMLNTITKTYIFSVTYHTGYFIYFSDFKRE